MGYLKRRGTVVAAALVFALTAAACGDADETSEQEPEPSDTADAAEEEADEPADDGEDAESAADAVDLSLTYASYGPEVVTVSQGMVRWLDNVAADPGVNLEWEAFWSEALLPAAEIMPGVAAGRADLGLMATVYHPAEFPLSTLSEVPFIADNPEAVARATMELYREYEPFRDEWHSNNIHLLGIGMFPPNVLVAKDPVDGLSDLAGLRMRSCGFLTPALEAIGVNTVAITQPEVYESLERGVLDASTCLSANLAADFSYHEVAPYLVGTSSGLFAQTYQVMNLDTWDSLPPEVQAVIEANADDYLDTVVELTMEAEAAACDTFADAGGSVSRLSEDDAADWRDTVFDDIIDTWTENTTSAGADAEAFLEEFLAAIERFEAEGVNYEPVFDRC